MLLHHYTLEKIVEEMRRLIGCKVSECFAQESDSMVIAFDDGIVLHYLQIYSGGRLSSIYLRPNFAKARNNVKELFHSINGEILQDISLTPADRIIRFEFVRINLYVFLFGGAKTNVIAVNKKGKIIESLNETIHKTGSKIIFPVNQLKSFAEIAPDRKLSSALSGCSLLLGKFYADELLQRIDLENKPIGEFTAEELADIYSTAELLKEECLTSRKYYILARENNRQLLSLIPLVKYSEIIGEYDSLSQAVHRRIVKELKDSLLLPARKSLLTKLERIRRKAQNEIRQIEESAKALERAEKYSNWAGLLASQPNPKAKAGDTVKLIDWEGNEVSINLDPKMSLMENSQRYYSKSRKSREGVKVRQARLPEFQIRLDKSNKYIELLNGIDDLKSLKKISMEIKKELGIKMEYIAPAPEDKFRTFDLGDGYMLYVGKNAANNDELTMRFAKPNDIWLHARGSGGSHAVLRMKGTTKPPKYILKAAASVAAYYSQARNAKYTPVAYTFKKYVRKPKGANPGSVVMSREDVVMVEPKLPV